MLNRAAPNVADQRHAKPGAKVHDRVKIRSDGPRSATLRPAGGGREIRSRAGWWCSRSLGVIWMPAAGVNAADRMNARRVLAGTIDIHVHSDPDNVPRSVDGLEAATLARASGMRGIVLKNHYDPTAGLAYLARKAAPGLEVFGGIDLNLHGRRDEPGGGRAPDAGRRRLGARRLDVHLRRREPGALLEGEPAVRQRLAERRTAAGNQGGHRASSPSMGWCSPPGTCRRRRA